MLASVKMATRVVLVDRLKTIDHELALSFGRVPSRRNTAIARGLLDNRAEVCDALLKVGYLPWDIPDDIEEAKVV